MKQNTAKTKPRELIISSAEISRFGMGVMSRALKIVDAAKKGKIIIKLEKQ
jgi:hypothetical protein